MTTKCILVSMYDDGQQRIDVDELSACDDWCFEFDVKKKTLPLPVAQAFDAWKHGAGSGCEFDYAQVHQFIVDTFQFHQKLIASCISITDFVEVLVIEASS